MYENVGIFLSHAHEDAAFARQLGNDLIRRGLRIWIDKAELRVGDSLLAKIAEGLETMDYLAVVMSSASVNSEWVRREVEIAMNEEIAGKRVKVLPILLEDCKVPSFLAGKLYADFRDKAKYVDALEELIARFRTVSPLQGLLRASLPAFTLRGVLLEEPILAALAEERVMISSLESDLVLESIKALIIRHFRDVDKFEDWSQGGEIMDTPPEMAARFKNCAKSLVWAESCGLRDGVQDIYQAVKKTLSGSAVASGTVGETYLKELINCYGAPEDLGQQTRADQP